MTAEKGVWSGSGESITARRMGGREGRRRVLVQESIRTWHKNSEGREATVGWDSDIEVEGLVGINR